MNTKNAKFALLKSAVLPLIVCLWVIGCEKVDLGAGDGNLTTAPLPDSIQHPVYSSNNWTTCGPVSVYQLTDANFNPQPVGPVPAGEVRISSGVDSMEIQANVNSYWYVTAVSWRSAQSEPDLGIAVWETDSMAQPTSAAVLHLARPAGSSVEMQVRVRCERFNIFGVTVYESWFSPMSHLRQDGSKYIHLELPIGCCGGGGPSSI